MTRTRTGIVLLALAQGLAAGCSASGSPVATAPTVGFTTQLAPYPNHLTLIGVSLFGVVSEMTPTGRQPVEGVVVYCVTCGKSRFTATHTDGNGYYSFSGDLSRDGGVWVQAGFTNPLYVSKAGYLDPEGRTAPSWAEYGDESSQESDEAAWREVTIDGDTRFDVELVRR
jgi:hypothetical protein